MWPVNPHDMGTVIAIPALFLISVVFNLYVLWDEVKENERIESSV
jgi:hypothetical protein